MRPGDVMEENHTVYENPWAPFPDGSSHEIQQDYSSAIPEDCEHQLPDRWYSVKFLPDRQTRMFPHSALQLGFWSEM
jgi:hypothetical protein